MNRWTVLIDTTSIQHYVFGSNKLKENIGASHIISLVLSDEFLISTGVHKEQIVYCGGGNAMLFFDGEDNAKEFVKKYSLKLIIEFPGVVPAFAIGEINFIDENDEGFQAGKDALFKLLNENKSKYIPQVIPLSHGFTAECHRSGYTLDVWDENDSEYVSSVIECKLNYSEDANKKVISFIPCDKIDKYCFTESFEHLGSTDNENSHIAVVFADGNSMGERFKQTKSAKEIWELSNSVNEATTKAFKKLIARIISEIDKIEKEITLSKEDGKTILPIRPIFIGGDDIVFVCDGRLGIYFAKIFLEEFEKHKFSDGVCMTACAGIAIVGKKFPFYRAHLLSEKLCKNAKTERKKTEKNKLEGNGSWIDYHISYGGYSGSLDEIRKKQFTAGKKNLLMRPYKLINNDVETSFDLLIKNTSQLFKKDNKTGKQSIPNSKIKELREILTKGEASIAMLIKEFEAREISLPDIKGKDYKTSLFCDNKTPYFDMLELYEFYPKYELEKGVRK